VDFLLHLTSRSPSSMLWYSHILEINIITHNSPVSSLLYDDCDFWDKKFFLPCLAFR
jgi:hypothetical protein